MLLTFAPAILSSGSDKSIHFLSTEWAEKNETTEVESKPNITTLDIFEVYNPSTRIWYKIFQLKLHVPQI